METSDVKRLRELEEENARLKKMYADLAMDNHILKDLFTKKGWALPPKCLKPEIKIKIGIKSTPNRLRQSKLLNQIASKINR